jgi:hypothetical protein
VESDIQTDDQVDVTEVVEDFDAAVNRVAESPDLRMVRRGLREALGHLYTLRERRKTMLGEQSYYSLADNSADGRTVEALVVLRAALVHQLSKRVTPVLKDAYSDTYTDLYDALIWLERSEMTDPPKSLKKSDYDQMLAGKDVYATLRTVRRFLVEPGVLGTLT